MGVSATVGRYNKEVYYVWNRRITGTQNAAPVLLDGLSKLEYRGYDSAGIAVVQGNRIAISKVTGRIQNLRERRTTGGWFPVPPESATPAGRRTARPTT